MDSVKISIDTVESCAAYLRDYYNMFKDRDKVKLLTSYDREYHKRIGYTLRDLNAAIDYFYEELNKDMIEPLEDNTDREIRSKITT